ncbi:hypothetical protein EON63_13215 [archaeon]|nr:MAG: hypothetical protein EON63_13215 [archaeon]
MSISINTQGRGAPEIDILEAMAGVEKLHDTPISRPYYSASYQVSPGIQDYRPSTGSAPDLSQWYHEDIEYGENASLNIFFYGTSLKGAFYTLFRKSCGHIHHTPYINPHSPCAIYHAPYIIHYTSHAIFNNASYTPPHIRCLPCPRLRDGRHLC